MSVKTKVVTKRPAPLVKSRWRLKVKGRWGQWIPTYHNSRAEVERAMTLAAMNPDIDAFDREDVPLNEKAEP